MTEIFSTWIYKKGFCVFDMTREVNTSTNCTVLEHTFSNIEKYVRSWSRVLKRSPIHMFTILTPNGSTCQSKCSNVPQTRKSSDGAIISSDSLLGRDYLQTFHLPCNSASPFVTHHFAVLSAPIRSQSSSLKMKPVVRKYRYSGIVRTELSGSSGQSCWTYITELSWAVCSSITM